MPLNQVLGVYLRLRKETIPMDPILRDVPEAFETERLFLRAPCAGDGAEMHEAIVESADHLRVWVPWAKPNITADEEEALQRKKRIKFLARESFYFNTYLKGAGTLVGVIGLWNIDWGVPKFEIGYFIRTSLEGQGYATEAVNGITRFAFDQFGALRIQITSPLQSWRVAERAGYTLEGIIRNNYRDVDGHLLDNKYYSKIG
jgi:RimJ/RimL family protein N-acetyltransferase